MYGGRSSTAEHRFVVPVVAGSSPVAHPIIMNKKFKLLIIILTITLACFFMLKRYQQKDLGVLVLSYHQISRNSKGDFSLPYDLFIKQLDFLEKKNYITISIDQLYRYIVEDEEIPKNSIVLTFDDSNESDYNIVFPELKKRGFIGNFFVIGSKIDNEVWRERLVEMKKGGMIIASHTMNHLNLAQIEEIDLIVYELEESKSLLEDIIQSEVNYLSWPFGFYTEETVKIAEDVGYRGLFMTKTDNTEDMLIHPIRVSGFNLKGENPLYVRRVIINGDYSFSSFKKILRDGIYPRPKSMLSFFFKP